MNTSLFLFANKWVCRLCLTVRLPQVISQDLLGKAVQSSKTDRVAKGKYDKMEKYDIEIVNRVNELANKYNCKMSQIAIAWHWVKGVASPIIGATKAKYFDDAVGAFDIKLTKEDIAYLEEKYVPHPIVGAINENPPQGVMLLDEKK